MIHYLCGPLRCHREVGLFWQKRQLLKTKRTGGGHLAKWCVACRYASHYFGFFLRTQNFLVLSTLICFNLKKLKSRHSKWANLKIQIGNRQKQKSSKRVNNQKQSEKRHVSEQTIRTSEQRFLNSSNSGWSLWLYWKSSNCACNSSCLPTHHNKTGFPTHVIYLVTKNLLRN